ncbi:MAG: hypothetical protein R2748_27535 [Bryobacterales bacterium]
MNVRSYHTVSMLVAVALCGCAAKRPPVFRVLPGTPEYLLEAPDASRTRFSEILGQYAGADIGWADLRPKMSLQIEQAYFREGAEAQDIRSYLGLESVRYAKTAAGPLREVEASPPLATRPPSQPAARTLLPVTHRDLPRQRLFYQLLLNPTEDRRAAVLLSAPSRDVLEQLATRLAADPAGTCRQESAACTAFPEHCSVSLQLEIEVDGKKTNVPWGTRLGRVAKGSPTLRLYRSTGARLERVELDPTDGQALGIPLLPGDRIETR